jgi:hypothetical protein
VLFTATKFFDIGVYLGTTVSLTHECKLPFAFDGETMDVKISQAWKGSFS